MQAVGPLKSAEARKRGLRDLLCNAECRESAVDPAWKARIIEACRHQLCCAVEGGSVRWDKSKSSLKATPGIIVNLGSGMFMLVR